MAKRLARGVAHSIDRGREAAIVAITALAILLFVGIASSVLAKVVHSALGKSETIDRSLLIALCLNIALILFGWRKHRDFVAETQPEVGPDERTTSLTSHDPLTGLLNRRGLTEEGSAMFGHARRRSKAMALLIVGLDEFGEVGNAAGQTICDVVLRTVAAGITNALPATALSARLDDDGFAGAFLFDPAHPDMVDRIAEQITSRLARPIDIDGMGIRVVASIGLARSDTHGASIDSLLCAADIAMRAAKDGGHDRHAWFEATMERALRDRGALEIGLRSAIPAGEIVPYFDQQIDLASGRLCGFEVLARWEHPSRGLIVAEDFISVAEDIGMIGDLSLSILRKACGAARDWAPALTLSVNLSPTQLRDAWLAQKIIKTLTETGFPASRLEIEITERALIDNLALAQSTVGSLKRQGVRIALDDFGTGYSSLSHLRALPFDRIKIDRSFVSSIDGGGDSAAVVAAIIGLCESLNLPITAEGILSAEIAERMRAIGCDLGQGYHYGRPLDHAATRRLLAEKRLLARPGDGRPASLRLAG